MLFLCGWTQNRRLAGQFSYFYGWNKGFAFET